MTKRKKKILAIEDNKGMAEVLKELLERNGYTPIAAASGYEGLYRYKYQKPDLILLDIDLPDLNGYEVCREIRRKCRDLHTPIFMLTGLTKDTNRVVGKVMGATRYIEKPFDSNELLEQIRDSLKE